MERASLSAPGTGRPSRHRGAPAADASVFAVVWRHVRAIEAGSVASYADIAESALGSRRAARTVGWALSGCPDDVPWWRVIRADGRLPGVRDDLQSQLLAAEGFTRFRRRRSQNH